MITWAGAIGKLIEFIITKLLGKKLDFALDEKKRACKVFLDFYDAVCRLEQITNQVVKNLELVMYEKRDRLHGYWFSGMSEEIEGATKEFLDSVKRVRRVISIYAPELDLLANRIWGFKRGIIAAASTELSPSDMKFQLIWKRRNSSLDLIEYTMPHEDLMKVDLEELFIRIRRAKTDDSYRLAHALGMPNDLLFALVHDNIISDKLKPDDISKIYQFHNILKQHLEVLVHARKLIGEFIKARFSIEDLLYADSNKRR